VVETGTAICDGGLAASSRPAGRTQRGNAARLHVGRSPSARKTNRKALWAEGCLRFPDYLL